MDRTVIHLEISGKHSYYGSPASMYAIEENNVERLGISQQALNNYFNRHKDDGTVIEYRNKRCIIRKGTMYVKPSTRGRKKERNDEASSE